MMANHTSIRVAVVPYTAHMLIKMESLIALIEIIDRRKKITEQRIT
jgi:hypothetical protein